MLPLKLHHYLAPRGVQSQLPPARCGDRPQTGGCGGGLPEAVRKKWGWLVGGRAFPLHLCYAHLEEANEMKELVCLLMSQGREIALAVTNPQSHQDFKSLGSWEGFGCVVCPDSSFWWTGRFS